MMGARFWKSPSSKTGKTIRTPSPPPMIVTIMWNHRTPGIPDEMFERLPNVPITKEEVRTIQISKARLNEGDTIYDIGSGSGSVSVEAAIQVGPSGTDLAVDRDPDAVKLTQANAAKFNLDDIIRVVPGEAVKVIPSLPVADAVFVGGTGGDTADILRICRGRMAPGGRIVIGTILVETLAEVLGAIRDTDLDDLDITQVTVLKSRRTSTGTMMLARNPVTILSASAPA